MKPKKVIEKLENSLTTIEELKNNLEETSRAFGDYSLSKETKEDIKNATKAIEKAISLIEDYKDLKKENKALKERLEGKSVSSQNKKELTKEEKERRDKASKLLEEVEKNKKAEPLPSVFYDADTKGPFEGMELEDEEIDEDMER